MKRLIPAKRFVKNFDDIELIVYINKLGVLEFQNIASEHRSAVAALSKDDINGILEAAKGNEEKAKEISENIGADKLAGFMSFSSRLMIASIEKIEANFGSGKDQKSSASTPEEIKAFAEQFDNDALQWLGSCFAEQNKHLGGRVSEKKN